MNAYEALAFSYDALTYDVPYEKIAAYFETLLRKSGVEAQTVLDLACGTGSLSVLLAARGYRVLGVDCSEEMLTVASEKAAELALETPPFFILQKNRHLYNQMLAAQSGGAYRICLHARGADAVAPRGGLRQDPRLRRPDAARTEG